MEALDGQLKKLHSALAHAVNQRRELANATVTFADTFNTLADAEEIKSLGTAMHHMADVENKVAKLFSKQAHRDFYDLEEIVADYIALIGAIRVSMSC